MHLKTCGIEEFIRCVSERNINIINNQIHVDGKIYYDHKRLFRALI